MQQENKKLLLHACCGICSGYPIENLKNLGYEVTVYFCNPNLDTQDEFNRRLEAQRIVCKNFNTNLIIEPYNHTEFLDFVKGFENEPERGKRCDRCIEFRLRRTADEAKSRGFDCFTTSLVISPHKNFKKISNLGEMIATDIGVKYLAIDFKKKDGFLKTNNISKSLKIYRQNYCGCEFAKG